MANVIMEEDTCPVCLKEFGNSKIGKLPCSHIFCYACILEWSKVSETIINFTIIQFTGDTSHFLEYKYINLTRRKHCKCLTNSCKCLSVIAWIFLLFCYFSSDTNGKFINGAIIYNGVVVVISG